MTRGSLCLRLGLILCPRGDRVTLGILFGEDFFFLELDPLVMLPSPAVDFLFLEDRRSLGEAAWSPPSHSGDWNTASSSSLSTSRPLCITSRTVHTLFRPCPKGRPNRALTWTTKGGPGNWYTFRLRVPSYASVFALSNGTTHRAVTHRVLPEKNGFKKAMLPRKKFFVRSLCQLLKQKERERERERERVTLVNQIL